MATTTMREVLEDIRCIVDIARDCNRTNERGNRQRVESWLSDLIDAIDDILATPEPADA